MSVKPAIGVHFQKKTPEGDDKERDVCGHCGFIDYKNPKIVVGAVLVHQGRVLLCRRAIEPRRGYWTLPAGFLELGETVEDGARREAFEEALVRPALDRVLAVYSVPRISQV
jgi:ADP-ribose pyrophosphatase YjhB (NUDIX family)